MTCQRCNGTQKLRSGAWCPDCTHEIEYRNSPVSEIAVCSCGKWRHVETRRQNALGRASKMRGAVSAHLREVRK